MLHSYQKLFFLQRQMCVWDSCVPVLCSPLIGFIVAFSYGQPLPPAHHKAASIPSSIKEHRRSLRLWTYSFKPIFIIWTAANRCAEQGWAVTPHHVCWRNWDADLLRLCMLCHALNVTLILVKRFKKQNAFKSSLSLHIATAKLVNYIK